MNIRFKTNPVYIPSVGDINWLSLKDELGRSVSFDVIDNNTIHIRNVEPDTLLTMIVSPVAIFNYGSLTPRLTRNLYAVVKRIIGQRLIAVEQEPNSEDDAGSIPNNLKLSKCQFYSTDLDNLQPDQIRKLSSFAPAGRWLYREKANLYIIVEGFEPRIIDNSTGQVPVTSLGEGVYKVDNQAERMFLCCSLK